VLAVAARSPAEVNALVAGEKTDARELRVGGEVVESVPGRIRVRLGGKGSVYEAPQRGSLSWLGIGRNNRIEMELRLQRAEDARDGQLRITVLLRPPNASLCVDPAWRQLCTQIFCDLRGYLMGQTGVVGSETAG